MASVEWPFNEREIKLFEETKKSVVERKRQFIADRSGSGISQMDPVSERLRATISEI